MLDHLFSIARAVGYSKSVNIVELKPGVEALVEEVYLSNYKPIEIWKCKSIDEALKDARKIAIEIYGFT